MEKYSATMLCKKNAVERDGFWAALVSEGLMIDKKTPTQKGTDAGIEMARLDNGAEYPLYPEDILGLLPKIAAVPVLSVAEYCERSGHDPLEIKSALAKAGILKESDGRFSPGDGFWAAGGVVVEQTSPTTGRPVRMMKLPERAFVRATKAKERGQFTSLSRTLKNHPELEKDTAALNARAVSQMLKDTEVLDGNGKPGPHAQKVGAVEKVNEASHYSYVVFDEALLVDYIKENLDKVPLSLQKKSKTTGQGSIPSIPTDATLVCFDTETTGFDPKADDLLQVTIVRGTIGDFTRGNPEVVLSTYVRPEKHEEWPEAEAVNHISPDVVFAHGVPTLGEIAGPVKEAFASADLVVGHNVVFDAKFMQSKFRCWIPLEKRVDTLKLAKSLLPKLSNHKLGTIVKELLPEEHAEFSAGAHDAKTDTIFTAKVLGAMAARFPELTKEGPEEPGASKENAGEEVEFG